MGSADFLRIQHQRERHAGPAPHDLSAMFGRSQQRRKKTAWRLWADKRGTP
jgi:hypothetical protein